ncbi:hypothetical protein ACHAXA_001543 [Cyclostephanos tholiformis]|uniref:serine O-acetyltransferase n=1 Tax=Cyclostephanos tholiformis TaxID=382380 RepID=A0ABD3R350_9STRA
MTNEYDAGNTIPSSSHGDDDELFLRLRREAAAVVREEPILAMLLSKVGLLDDDCVVPSSSSPPSSSSSSSSSSVLVGQHHRAASSFEEAISRIVSHRLSSCSGKTESICPNYLRNLLEESFDNVRDLEMGHTMTEAVRMDAMAILNRDPACETLLEAVLFMKGFHSLVLHRAARRAWRPSSMSTSMTNDDEIMDIAGDIPESGEGDDTANIASGGLDPWGEGGGRGGKRFVALLLQSLASSAFGVDIHPASSIGAGIMIDHATGVVIGETASVGDGTTILHGVTLGGTGKETGDRHPKIGRHVLIGAGTQILGNITVGDRSKIGAGSVVLRPIPSGATAVGAPARIIGFTARGERPGSTVDMNLKGVEPLLGDARMGLMDATKKSYINVSKILRKDTSSTEMDSSGGTKTISNDAGGDSEVSGHATGDSEDSTSKEDDRDGVGGVDEEEDDNVTDFGTPPKCRWRRASSGNDGLCPFRGMFGVIPADIKRNCITHKRLRDLLLQEGCSEGECLEVYFELLHSTPSSSDFRRCGAIPLEVYSKCFPDIAKEKTGLDADRVQALAEGDLRALGMSKKASRRFKSFLNRLGASTSSRVPSSS